MELLTAMVVGTIVMAAVYAVINLSQKSSAGIERRVAAQQDQKAALELMAMEIAMASYDPQQREPWLNMNCSGVLRTAARGIPEATANAITVQMDISDDGEIMNFLNNQASGNAVDDNEVIRYVYDETNSFVSRATNCTTQEFLGSANANHRTVRVINNELNLDMFRYFDGQGNELAAPVNIPNIRRILITLAVETENIDPTTGQRRRLVYSTSAIVRNHLPVFGMN